MLLSNTLDGFQFVMIKNMKAVFYLKLENTGVHNDLIF